ncbi:hypothetical protein [Planomonospora sp. ID82291]|uniref:hypothetical protein n=1 Tax=Planomonospora sp. ID82291 TaxID=2738136 RepID=UPI0018C425D3|nr:hypothetical protein [Planomonospora sp. ID82291]MBG0818927.1 hypothetical protein [Planomonospora sp. ID82291]
MERDTFDPHRILKQIGLPHLVTAETLVDHFGAALGRTIQLDVITGLTRSGWCGLWVLGGDGIDYLFIDAGYARIPALKAQVAAHELGHIVAGHDQSATSEGNVISLLQQSFPHLPPAVIARAAAARSTYDQPAEQEAEAFATAVMSRAAAEARRASGATGRRAEGVLGHPLGGGRG